MDPIKHYQYIQQYQHSVPTVLPLGSTPPSSPHPAPARVDAHSWLPPWPPSSAGLRSALSRGSFAARPEDGGGIGSKFDPVKGVRLGEGESTVSRSETSQEKVCEGSFWSPAALTSRKPTLIQKSVDVSWIYISPSTPKVCFAKLAPGLLPPQHHIRQGGCGWPARDRSCVCRGTCNSWVWKYKCESDNGRYLEREGAKGQAWSLIHIPSLPHFLHTFLLGQHEAERRLVKVQLVCVMLVHDLDA